MTRERAVKAEDIERYRRALTELGGQASLEQLAEHAGTGETDIGYIAACLIVPAPDRAVPFAVPSASGRDDEGRRLWRTEDRWTPDDLRMACGSSVRLAVAGGHESGGSLGLRRPMALEKELETYRAKLPELTQHEGKYVPIHGEHVAAIFVLIGHSRPGPAAFHRKS